uniref:Protein XRP2 n=1 Tax=Timema californicum TaxID=61474 RepID=A0A7R9JIA1_TIMCA|nr:unnamed protein product [Timema californicum]
MGCLLNKTGRQQPREMKKDTTRKEYSWDKRTAVDLQDYTGEGNVCYRDKRTAVDLQDYTVEGITDGEVWRMPGSVRGEQLLVQNCVNARIFVLDHINSVNMDSCTNCTVVFSAVRGSVFLRDCKECVCLTACGQLRTRDCWKMNVFLLCATQPIIESSTSIHLGCYQLTYTGLEGLEGESVTGLEGESLTQAGGIDLSLAGDTSVVPYTWGPHKNPSGESCLVTLFYDSQQSQRARAFINCLRQDNPACLLLRTKEGLMTPADAERVFLSSSYNHVVGRGPVVGLYYDGPDCILSCQRVNTDPPHSTVAVALTVLTGLVYVSNSPAAAQSQVDDFFTHAQLGQRS